MNILIVDDEDKIRELIRLNLEVAGYNCFEAIDGLDAINKCKNNNYDLVLLDITMPNIDGYEVADYLNSKEIPFIFLSAKDSTIDKVKGLKLGSDDYITKPFETIELIARVDNVLRRNKKINDNIRFKNINIDINSRLVYLNNKEIDLTNKEYGLLLVLIKNKNIALSREKLLELVWNYDFLGDTRTVDIHIKNLRKKLNLVDDIVTVHKYGYRLIIK